MAPLGSLSLPCTYLIICATGRRSLLNPSSSANALLRFATALADQLAVGGVLDERHNNRRLELVHETRQVRRKGTTCRRAFSKPPRILVRIRPSKSASSCTGASSGLGSRQPATQNNRYQAQSRAMSTDCSRAIKRLRAASQFFLIDELRIACDLIRPHSQRFSQPLLSPERVHVQSSARRLRSHAATIHVCAQCSGAFKTVVVWNPIYEFSV